MTEKIWLSLPLISFLFLISLYATLSTSTFGPGLFECCSILVLVLGEKTFFLPKNFFFGEKLCALSRLSPKRLNYICHALIFLGDRLYRAGLVDRVQRTE